MRLPRVRSNFFLYATVYCAAAELECVSLINPGILVCLRVCAFCFSFNMLHRGWIAVMCLSSASADITFASLFLPSVSLSVYFSCCDICSSSDSFLTFFPHFRKIQSTHFGKSYTHFLLFFFLREHLQYIIE